jgi:hypothetical protein
MTQYVINIGAIPNDGTGDPLRTAFNEVNLNFNQVWDTGLVGSNITIANNTILTSNTNGNLVLAPNGVGKVIVNTDVLPDLDRLRSLGSNSYRWDTIYTQYANISSGLNIAGNLAVGGNLTVQGNIIQIGNIVTDSLTIQLANTANTPGAANGSGITVGANDDIATILYNSTSNVWTTNIGISSVGNVTAPYFFGNGSQLTGLPASYSNANVATFLAAYGSNTISTTGNITANFYVGNGSQLTGIVSSYGNANVVANLAALGSNPISTTGNVTGGNLLFSTGIVSGTGNITSGNIGITGGSLTWANASIVQTSASDFTITGDGQVTVRSLDGTYQWTFDNAGNLTLPTNGDLNFAAGGIKQILNEDFVITASDDENDGWSIYNVIDDGTGNTFTDTRLSNDQFDIRTNVQGASPYTWAFRDTGVLELPGDIYGNVGGNLTVRIGDQAGSDTFIDLQTRSYTGDALISNIRIANPNVTISTAGGANTWTFDATGNLTVPSNTWINSPTGSNGNINFHPDGNGMVIIQGGNGSQSGVLLNLTSDVVNSLNRIEIDTYGTSNVLGGALTGSFARGNSTNPEAVQAGDRLASLRGKGFNGVGYTVPTGQITIDASDNWSANVHPTRISFWTTASNVDILNMQIDPDGNVDIYNGNLVVSGNGGGYFAGNVSAAGNITGGNLVTAGSGGNITLTGGNITGANVVGANTVSATGNVQIISSGNTWNFDTTGSLTLPGGSRFRPLGPNLDIFAGTGSYVNLITSDESSYMGVGGAGGYVVTAGGTWDFNTNGNLTAPGNVSAVGNITGGNILTSGLISATGNISANNLSLAGNITSNIGFTGSTITINNAPGGNEGAEVIWALPSPANTVLTTSLVQDVFQNGMRFFESGGNSRGLYMDLGNVPNGSATAVGYRDIPQVSFTGNTTIATTDAGRHYYSVLSTGNVLTIANNASQGFQVGAAITVVNQGTGNITVAQGSGVTLYLAGNATSGNRTVTTFGMATIIKVATDTWFINGTGVS